MLITPQKIYTENHCYQPISNNPQNKYLYNETHIYQICEDLSLTPAGTINIKQKNSRSISFHPTKQLVGIITNDFAQLCDFSGNHIWQQNGDFSCILFSRDGNKLWLCEKSNKNQIKISIFHTTGDLILSYEFEDKLYDSALRICDIPNSDHIALELAAGQDGIIIYDIHFDETEPQIKMTEMFPHCSYILPTWHESGETLLTLENDEMLYALFNYPKLGLITEQDDLSEEFETEEEEEDNHPGYNLLILKNNLGVVQNSSYRHYIFNLSEMTRLEEIKFKGYEPVPTNQVFPRLANDTTLYSELIYLDRIGDLLIAKTHYKDKKQHVLLIKESDFINQL